jgi:predicted Zn-dependent peptidase
MCALRKRVTDGVDKVGFRNALSLTLRPDRRVPVAAARCYVRGGSVAEDLPGGRGIAHLLEHLIATAAAAEMEQHGDGALLNAFTTHDYTCYHWSALEEDVVSSLRRFFAGLRRAASLSLDDLEAEKKVVLQEIDLFREKRLAVFQQCFLEEMFEVHPLRYPVCGYGALLREVGNEALSAYIEKLYTGANLNLVVTGAFDEQAVVATVDEACDSLPRGQRFELQVEEPRGRNPRVFEMDAPGGREGYTQVGLRFAGGGLDEAVAFAALAQCVNGTVRRELAESCQAFDVEARSVASAFGAGYFTLLARHPPSGGDPVETAIRRWLEDVAAGCVPLSMAAARSSADQEEDPTMDGWAALLGHGEVRSGCPLESWQFQERLRTIQEEDVIGAVARNLGDFNLTIGRFRHRAAASAATAPRPAPDFCEDTLPNGVRLLILPTTSAESSCQVLWKGGVLAETWETNGLCSLMARILPSSLPGDLRPKLAQYRRSSDADFFAFCDENFFGVSLTARERDFEAGLELLSVMAARPAFAGEAVEDERRRTAEWVSAPPAAWLPKLQAHLKQRLYRRHPYRMSEIGRPDSLARLTLDDVASCHRRTCVGENTVVVVTGRGLSADLRDRLASLFEAIPPGAFSDPYGAGEDDGIAPDTVVVSSPWGFGAVAVGYRGVAWEPETWGAFELLKALLVGPENNSVRGRLMRAMRGEASAYSAQCFNQAGFGEGYFAILAAYDPGKEEAAVGVARREIERLHAGDIAAREMEHCRKLYLLQHLRQYESARANAYGAGRHMLFSSRPGSWTMIPEQLRQITVDDVASAARRVFCDQRRSEVLLRPQGD